MIFVILFFCGLFVLSIISDIKDAKERKKYGKGMRVKVQVQNAETGRTLHTGNGTCIGEAVAHAFSKMYYSVSISSHDDTIKSKLDSMKETLAENRWRMYDRDIEKCERYIGQMRNLLARKEEDRLRAEREHRNEELERKRYQQEKKIQNLEERMGRAENLTTLMKSIRYAEELQLNEYILKENAWLFPNVNNLLHEGSSEVVNAFLQAKFDELRNKALEPVSMSDFSKYAYALRKSIDASYDDLPNQSQLMYAKYRKEVFGDD